MLIFQHMLLDHHQILCSPDKTQLLCIIRNQQVINNNNRLKNTFLLAKPSTEILGLKISKDCTITGLVKQKAQ